MQTYVYKAFNGRGLETKGRLTGENEQGIACQLKAMGLFPTMIMTSEEQEKIKQEEDSPEGKIRRMCQAELRDIVLEVYSLATDIETRDSIHTFGRIKDLFRQL